ncbi:hypothetical protein AND4_09572 [Vibrio sp. AND4]|nr:hypothetical protein AND4_09572 [Vibrio sp. AND4]
MIDHKYAIQYIAKGGLVVEFSYNSSLTRSRKVY